METVAYQGPGGSLGTFTRGYDILGRVTTETGPLVNRDYQYDGLGRMVQARDYDPNTLALMETRGYGFDANTNRTSLTVTPAGGSPTTTSYQIASDGSDRLTSVNGGTAFSYDGNGNTVSMPGRSMGWSAANRLLEATASGVTVDYLLDPLGRTLTRTTTGGAEAKSASYHYASDGDTPSWVTDIVDSVSTTTRYVNGGGGLLATQVVGGSVSYPLYNPHGDIWAHTDATGTITGTFEYDEYGNPQQPPSGGEDADRYGWLGLQQGEWDPEVRLTLMGVRGYDPTLGRFLSVDPIHGGSANHYDYVSGDPINSYDLDGTKQCRRNGRKWCYREPISKRFGRVLRYIAPSAAPNRFSAGLSLAASGSAIVRGVYAVTAATGGGSIGLAGGVLVATGAGLIVFGVGVAAYAAWRAWKGR